MAGMPARPSISGDNCMNCNSFFVFTGRRFDRETGKCYNIFQCPGCNKKEEWATDPADCPDVRDD